MHIQPIRPNYGPPSFFSHASILPYHPPIRALPYLPYARARTQAWTDGMVMAVSLWGGDDLGEWFDNECPSGRRHSVDDAQVTFS